MIMMNITPLTTLRATISSLLSPAISSNFFRIKSSERSGLLMVVVYHGNMKTIIVAMDRNRAIGFNNDLPWGRSLKDDLANFKKLTTGTSIIMGRNTFESIGRALPNRENIVVSHTPTTVSGVLTALSIDAAYALARYPIMIIGGGQIYEQTMKDADRIIATMVDAEFPEATVYFPKIDADSWHEVSRQHYDADDRNAYAFDIVTFERKP